MFKSVTLEMSLKPFKKTDEKSILTVCERVFEDWKHLLEGREVISIMLWCADGSEILDYNKNLDEEFEWCKYIGSANKPMLPEGAPHETSLHYNKRLYMENPPKMTYNVLKNIISIIKAEGKRRFPSAKIRVGETFDIGPEFAVSTFKYKRHPEICGSLSNLDGLGFVDSTALLHADERSYAAYPNGIPEGEPFGIFLGKQANIFLADMGFDYIWLSNGLGFSADPWRHTGKIFDGKCFHSENLGNTAEQVFKFWKYFRQGCPDYLIETRGTNNTVGIDYASDGVPLYDIYNADLNITPPPNSPWAALDKNYGLEIAGQMSRCCEIPYDVFPFRFYIHDPWWVNSPWYDRYEGQPGDIYMPMAISRIDEKGQVQAANTFNILTIDNSFGNMPKACVTEPLPHILKAEKESPDRIAPLVWIYPMREYTTSKSEEMLREMYTGDKFICQAINHGLPLCTVASADLFLKHEESIYQGSVLIAPAKMSNHVLEKLNAMAEAGGKIILYGGKDVVFEVSKRLSRNVKYVDITDEDTRMKALFDAMADNGYFIEFEKKAAQYRNPIMTLSRYDNAFMFSVFNMNATTDTKLSMPLGAPIMIGAEVEIKENAANYRFPKFTHGECRIFVKQEDGVVECHEEPPVNERFRRRIRVSGLKNAELCFFPEENVADTIIADPTKCMIHYTPVAEKNLFLPCEDEYGKYYRAKNLTGEFYIYMGYRSK